MPEILLGEPQLRVDGAPVAQSRKTITDLCVNFALPFGAVFLAQATGIQMSPIEAGVGAGVASGLVTFLRESLSDEDFGRGAFKKAIKWGLTTGALEALSTMPEASTFGWMIWEGLKAQFATVQPGDVKLPDFKIPKEVIDVIVTYVAPVGFGGAIVGGLMLNSRFRE